MDKPKEQIFLTQLKSVDVPSHPPKGGQFVFEVKGKGVHWVMNAPSHVSPAHDPTLFCS